MQNQTIEVNSDDYGIIQLIRRELGTVDDRHYTEAEVVSWLVEFALVTALSQGNIFRRWKYGRKLRSLMAKYPNLVTELKAVWSL